MKLKKVNYKGLTEMIDKVINKEIESFDLCETVLDDIEDDSINTEYNTENYQNWFGVKMIEVFDGNYLACGLYGGNCGKIYNIDLDDNKEIAKDILSNLTWSNTVYIEIK